MYLWYLWYLSHLFYYFFIFFISYLSNLYGKENVYFYKKTKIKPTYEYLLIKDVNDSLQDANELIKFCKETLAGFKCPKKVIFGELPKTSTGKILKYELREKAKQ